MPFLSGTQELLKIGNNMKNGGGASHALTLVCTWCLVFYFSSPFLYQQPCSRRKRHSFVVTEAFLLLLETNGARFLQSTITRGSIAGASSPGPQAAPAGVAPGRQNGLLPEMGWVGCWLQATTTASFKSRSPDVFQADVPIGVLPRNPRGAQTTSLFKSVLPTG